MAKLYLIIIIFLFSILAHAKEKLIVCPLMYYSSVKEVVEKNGAYDKYKHCAVSCMLTLRCPATDVIEIGILKELADTVGPGNAEFEDLHADFQGVELASTRKAKTDNQCISSCHKIYPEPTCK